MRFFHLKLYGHNRRKGETMKKNKPIRFVIVAAVMMCLLVTTVFAHTFVHSFQITHTYYEEYDEFGNWYNSYGELDDFDPYITVSNVVKEGHGHHGTCELKAVDHQPTFQRDYYSQGEYLGFDMITVHVGHYRGTLYDN